MPPLFLWGFFRVVRVLFLLNQIEQRSVMRIVGIGTEGGKSANGVCRAKKIWRPQSLALAEELQEKETSCYKGLHFPSISFFYCPYQTNEDICPAKRSRDALF